MARDLYENEVFQHPIPHNALYWNSQRIVCTAHPGYFVVDRASGSTIEHHNSIAAAIDALDDIQD